MLKIIGVLMIIICCCYYGFYKADGLKKRLYQLSILYLMFEEIAILLKFKAMTVTEIMNNLKENDNLSDLAFIKNYDTTDYLTSVNKKWSESIDCSELYLNDADKKMLKAFGSSFGTSDLNGQISTVSLYQTSFSDIEIKAKEEYQKKSKLYRSLGVLAGVFIGIILI